MGDTMIYSRNTMPKVRTKTTNSAASPYAVKKDSHNVLEVLSKINQRLENLEKKVVMDHKESEETVYVEEGNGVDAEGLLHCITPETGKRSDENQMIKTHHANESGDVPKSTFCSGGRKITSIVSSKMKNKIWSNQFINLHELLKESDEKKFSIVMESSSEVGASVRLISKKQNSSSQSLTLNAWAKAFNRFTAIMSVKFPECSIGLNQHMETVFSIAEQNGNWVFYDAEFRHMINRNDANWGSTDLELYLCALMKSDSKNPKVDTDSLELPKGACYRYHTTGSCAKPKQCKYQHNCTNCLRNHPRFKCPVPANEPKLLSRFAQPFKLLSDKENSNSKSNNVNKHGQ